MGANKMCELVVVVAVVVAVMMAGVGEAQNTASCASELTACADYLNSTSPPANCCTPLKNAVENDKDCLCNLYNNPSLLQSLNINVTDALQLPKNCGITEELNCNGVLSFLDFSFYLLVFYFYNLGLNCCVWSRNWLVVPIWGTFFEFELPKI